jgi:DNA mismatch repair ATPase MutS
MGRVSQAKSTPGSSRLGSWIVGGLVVVAALAAMGWWMGGPSLASQTIEMQLALLELETDPAACRSELRAIMRNIDQMQLRERQTVQSALFRRLGQMRQESLEAYFSAANTAEKTALLDRDIARIAMIREVVDAVDQGGMRVRTKEDEQRAEERRRRAAAQPPAGKQASPVAPKAVDPQEVAAAKKRNEAREAERTRQEAYTDALVKRAEQKGVDLGRFGRSGRRR